MTLRVICLFSAPLGRGTARSWSGHFRGADGAVAIMHLFFRVGT